MSAVFLSARVLHILLGAIWLGGAVLLAMFIMPAIKDVGPDGGKVMGAAMKRGLTAFIPSVGGATVLTGLWLYWTRTNGFDLTLMKTMSGHVFGLGGVLGIAAAIIGGSVVGRSVKNAATLMEQAAALTDPAARGALVTEADRQRQRAAAGGKVVAILLVLTIVLMSVGRYV